MQRMQPKKGKQIMIYITVLSYTEKHGSYNDTYYDVKVSAIEVTEPEVRTLVENVSLQCTELTAAHIYEVFMRNYGKRFKDDETLKKLNAELETMAI